MEKQPNVALLIIVRGLPGSGKTYVAQQLVHTFNKDEVVMLDPDEVDQTSPAYLSHVAQATVEGVDPALHLYRYLRGQAYQGIADKKVIIWNQPFTNLEIFNKMMANLRIQADEHNVHLQVLVVEVEVDTAVAKERVATRKEAGGHGPSHVTFDRFVNDYHSFADHGYTTVQIDGAADVNSSVQQIQTAIRNLT
jgi:predicted ABC-type ATPase